MDHSTFAHNAHRPVAFIALISILLFTFSGLGVEKVQAGPLSAATPSLSMSVPPEGFIGNTISFSLSFSNSGSAGETGYGPYVDLYLPQSGADGTASSGTEDGITFNSAKYLGLDLKNNILPCPAGGSVVHPLTGLSVTCPAAPAGLANPFVWQMVVLTLPFGSFTVGQPAVDLTVSATISNLADLNTLLPIRASSGFRFGTSPTGNTPIQGAAVTESIKPTILTVRKTNNAPEDETATGPNYPREYTIHVDVANGQTVTNLDVIETLPPNLVFLEVVSTSPSGGTVTDTPLVGAPSTTDNQLVVRFPSVTGGAGSDDATVTLRVYVPRLTATSTDVIPASTGAATTSVDTVRAESDWTPLDTRDTLAHSITNATSDLDLTDRSLAVQKTVAIVGKSGVSNIVPGDTLEYTINFQVSDFFAFQNVALTDVISDGLRLDETFTPTLQMEGNDYSLTALGMQAANLQITPHYSTGPHVDPNDGTTQILFYVSQELASRGQSTKLVGGCIPLAGSSAPDCSSYNNGATQGTVKFRAVVQEAYSDVFPSGDQALNQGDSVSNNVTVSGDLLSTADLSTVGPQVTDTSTSSSSIAYGVLNKSIYAVNGTACATQPCSTVLIAPGDLVTYRIQYSLVTGDYEDLTLTDFLPLPIFKADDPDADSATPGPAWSMDASGTSSDPPAVGMWKRGPADTENARSGQTPATSVDSNANYLRFNYGTYDDLLNTPVRIDLLFTVAASTDPFADGLYLTNQVREQDRNTETEPKTNDQIIQLIMTEPVIVEVTKGVVATDSAAGVYSPTGALPDNVSVAAPGTSDCATRFSGSGLPVSSTSWPGRFDSNLSGVDAGDRVRFALVVENVGQGLNGAFDVQIKDSMPSGLKVPAGGMNLCVNDGAGEVISTTNIGAGSGLFDQGIQLNDPGPTATPTGALDPGKDTAGVVVTSGRNIAIVTYDLEVDTTAVPLSTLTNTADLLNYTGKESKANYVLSSMSDDASVSLAATGLAKAVTGTDQAHTSGNNVAVGEVVTYQVTATIPEGTSPAVSLVDTLPAGLAFKDCTGISASAGLSTTLSGGFTDACTLSNPVVTSQGGVATWDLGTITNSNNDAAAETVTITYRAVVTNVSTNVNAHTLHNSAVWSYTGGSVSASAPNVTVVEPALQVVKSANPTTGDAGDEITFSLIVSHTAGSTADAFDINLSDLVPTGMTYVNNSLVNSSGVAATLDQTGAPTLKASWSSLTQGSSSTIQFKVTLDNDVAPGETITNQASIDWSSLPGTSLPPQSNYSTVSTERTGNTADPGGTANTYRASGSTNVLVFAPAPQKSIVTTSESFTGAVSGTERVAIGEIVRYRLVSRLAEGKATNFQMADVLPAGMRFINDAQVMVGFVSTSSGITSSDAGISGAGLNIAGDEATLSGLHPTFTLPTGNISGGTGGAGVFLDGDDPVFSLGDLTNIDNDATQEYVIVEFNALVDNVASNQAFNNASGASIPTSLDNSFQVRVNGNTVATSTTVSAVVAEPLIRTLTKAITTTPHDAGDTVEYTLTFSNTASIPNAAPAFDVRVTDAVNTSYLSLQSVTWSVPAEATVTNNTSGNDVDVTLSQMNAGSSATVTVTARVLNTVYNRQIIPNSAKLTYQSLPGTGTCANATGSCTPGATGADNGERDGSGSAGALNDYLATSNTVNSTLDSPSISKSVSKSLPTIGEQVTYSLLVTLKEGVTKDLKVEDTLPSGMQYVSSNIITTSAASGGLLTADFNGTLPDPGAPTVTVNGDNTTSFSLNFGDTTTTANGVASDDRFLVQIVAQVKNIGGNVRNTTLANTGYIRFTNPNDLSTVSSSSTANVTLVEPGLTIAKTIPTPANPVDAGGTLTYRIVVSNPVGTNVSTAYDVHVTDTLPAYLTNPGTPTITLSGGAAGDTDSTSGSNLDITIASIPAGGSATIEITATISDAIEARRTVTNQADVAYTSLSGVVSEERSYSGSNSVSFTVDTPTVDKLAPSPSQYRIGESINYNLLVSLPEGVTRGLAVVDTLPVGLEYVSSQVIQLAASSGGLLSADYNGTLTVPGSATVTGSAATGTTVRLTFGDTTTAQDGNANNDNFLVVITARVSKDVASNQNGVTRSNTGAVEYQDPVSGTQTMTDTPVSITVIEPIMAVTKSFSPVKAAANDTVTITLTATNSGDAAAYEVNLEDALPTAKYQNILEGTTPAGFTFSAAPSGANTLVTYTGGTINANTSATFTFTAQLTTNVTKDEVLANTGRVTQATTLPGTDSNERFEPVVTGSANLTVIAVDIALNKTDSRTYAAGGNTLVYNLQVSNLGERAADGVTITEKVPAHTTFNAGASTSGWSCVSDTCTYTVGALAGSASSTVQFAVTVDDPLAMGVNQITNDARADDNGTHGADSDPANNTTQDVDATTADLSIEKDDTPDPVVAGQDLSYTLTVTNNGPADASSLTVTDTLPSGETYVSATGTGWTCNHVTGTVTCTRTSLAAAASSGITLTVHVSPTVTSTLSNTASVSAPQTDPVPGNNSSTETTDITTQADLEITKTDSPDPVLAGQTLTYTLTVTNHGPSDAASVSVSDTLPAGISYVSATGTDWTCNYDSGTRLLTCTRSTLAYNATSAITVATTVNSGVTAGTTLQNQAQVTSSTTDPVSTNNQDAEDTTVNTQADLSLTKTDASDPVVAGTDLVYTLHVENAGPSDAVDLSVTDTLPAGVSYVSASGTGWTCTYNSDTRMLTCTRASMLSGAQSDITLTVHVAPDTTGTLSNTGNVTSETTDPNDSNNHSTQTTTVGGGADLAIVKTDDPDPVVAGRNLTYTLTVTNNGPSQASNLSVSDTLPAGVTFVSASGTGWTCNEAGGTVTCTRPSLAYNATSDITLVVTVNLLTSGPLSNTATVSSSTTDGTPGNNTSTAETQVTIPADLSIVKTAAPDPVTSGQDVTYTLTVSNAGPGSASTISVTDTLPDSVTYKSASGTGWTCGAVGNAVTCTLTSLAQSASANVITIVATVKPGTTGNVNNTASVSAVTPDPDDSNNEDSAQVGTSQVSNVSVVETAVANPVTAGEEVTLPLTVNNLGPSDAATVTLVDQLPAGVTFVSASGTGWTCSYDAGTHQVTCTRPLAVVGEELHLNIVVEVDPSTTGTLQNQVSISSVTTDSDLSNNQSNGVLIVEASADLSILKTGTPDPVLAGHNLTYTLAVTNHGPSDAGDVQVSDPLPTGLSLVSATGDGWECIMEGATLHCAHGRLAANQTSNITVVVTVGLNSSDPISNTATVSSQTPDPDPTNNESTCTTGLLTEADLSVVKTADADPAVAGTDLVYTLDVANHGPSDALNVVVTDPLPAGVEFISASGDGWTCSSLSSVVSCSRGLFANGATSSITIRVQILLTAVGPLQNQASISASNPDPVPNNNASTVSTQLNIPADLSVVKTVDTNPYTPGSVLNYTITVTNNGPGVAQNVIVSDALPAELVYLDSTPKASLSSGVLRWFVGSMDPGATLSFRLSTRVESWANRPFINRAVVSSSTVDLNPDNNQQSLTSNLAVPTAVELVNFTASAQNDGQVLLQWVTGAEVNTFGFKILRADVQDVSQASEVHFEKGGSADHTYTWVDDTAPAAETLWYWIIELDNQNNESYLNPHGTRMELYGQHIYLPAVGK